MAAISLFWCTNMAAVTSDENDLLFYIIVLNIVAANSNFKPRHQARAFSKFTNED
jgi:hypothetical protein